MKTEACLVLCTCPNLKVANELAHQVIESGLAACINILPEINSIYTWQGKTESASEILLFIKTTVDAYPKLEMFLKTAHPYECPEVIGIPINHGLTGYLKWIKDSVSAEA
jgi:periplasmic divalent cation tolerance protein